MDCEFNEPLFFEGEDAEALKTQFVELWAAHSTLTAYQIAAAVFRKLRDPGLRQGKAAEVWAADLDVLERIKAIQLKGPPEPDDSDVAIRRRLVMLADDRNTEPKDAIAALGLLAKMGGYIKKDADEKSSANDNSSTDFLAALSAKLPN